MKTKETKKICIATRITKPMHKAVLKLVQRGAHLNLADYLRDLIRKDLANKRKQVARTSFSEESH